MKESFCFLFGLIVGGGGAYFGAKLVLNDLGARMAYFKGLHRTYPGEYHLACELDTAEQDLLQVKIGKRNAPQ